MREREREWQGTHEGGAVGKLSEIIQGLFLLIRSTVSEIPILSDFGLIFFLDIPLKYLAQIFIPLKIY